MYVIHLSSGVQYMKGEWFKWLPADLNFLHVIEILYSFVFIFSLISPGQEHDFALILWSLKQTWLSGILAHLAINQ